VLLVAAGFPARPFTQTEFGAPVRPGVVLIRIVEARVDVAPSRPSTWRSSGRAVASSDMCVVNLSFGLILSGAHVLGRQGSALVAVGLCAVVVFGMARAGSVVRTRKVLDEVLDPAEQGNAREHVVSDLVDEHPEVLRKHLAGDRLLDEIELCRAGVLVPADPPQQEAREPGLGLVPTDLCRLFRGVVSGVHEYGVPLSPVGDALDVGRGAYLTCCAERPSR